VFTTHLIWPELIIRSIVQSGMNAEILRKKIGITNSHCAQGLRMP